MTGVLGSVPGNQPDSLAINRKAKPITRLARGPTIAIQNSDLASDASDSICDTPPRANNVIERTFNPYAFATSECAISCARRAAKNRSPVIIAADHTTGLLHWGVTL